MAFSMMSNNNNNNNNNNKSTLVAASPPFNPGNPSLYAGPRTPPHNSHHHRTTSSSSSHSRSRSVSPYAPHSHYSNYNSNNNISNSNAVAKYTFNCNQGQTLEMRNVWAENVAEEMACIRSIIDKYPYVAMDTEFPGVVAKPITEAFASDYHYKSLKVNVDLLKIIQLGLSFADKDGNFCPGCPCWQFNFKFDLDGDMFAQDSIDLLQKSGISFPDHAARGIDPLVFGELLMVSGLVLNDKVKWVSFHSGYDYGYLLKLLTTQELPLEEKSFFDLLKIYFPTIYDIKYMTSLLDGHQFMGGLQKLADDLNCQRLGAEHQAGSDSLLTMSTYFALCKAKFSTKQTINGESVVDDSKFANELFGYGTNHTVRKAGANRELSNGGISD